MLYKRFVFAGPQRKSINLFMSLVWMDPDQTVGLAMDLSTYSSPLIFKKPISYFCYMMYRHHLRRIPSTWFLNSHAQKRLTF